MNLLIFCSVFILQFMGHRLGDYFFQTNAQAVQKANNWLARLRHCLVYSVIVASLTLFVVDWKVALIIFAITIVEHMWIDSRKPIVKYKEFLERKIARTKDFKVEDLPFFVIVDIDQTVHYLRIFIISLLIAYGVIA